MGSNPIRPAIYFLDQCVHLQGIILLSNEQSSGGRRLHDPEKIKSRLREQSLDPKNFDDHLKAFDWGMPPHSGWGLGLDRLLAIITGVDNIREVVLYPRDPERLKP